MIASGLLMNTTPSSSDSDVTRIWGSQDFAALVIATSQEIITRYGDDVQDVECLSARAGFRWEYIPFPYLLSGS